MSNLAPIAMSQTKEDLLKHLNLTPETYTLMAKETDVIYNWLISHKSHLKENGKRKAPYDWSDIQERAKDDAIAMISQGGDQYTDYFWNIGVSADKNPNWVARWFLYHKFRYRDGRNRTQKSAEKHHDRHGSSKHKRSSRVRQAEYDHEYPGTTTAGSSSQGDSPPVVEANTTSAQDEAAQYSSSSRDSPRNNCSQSGTYYDPVRDILKAHLELGKQ